MLEALEACPPVLEYTSVSNTKMFTSLLAGDDVIQAAVADVVGPAVAAEDPHGLLGQVLLLAQQVSGDGAGRAVAEQSALGLQLGSVLSELRHSGQLLYGADAVLQSLDVGTGSLGIGLAVLHGVQPCLSGGLQLGTGPLHGDQLAGLLGQILTDLVLADDTYPDRARRYPRTGSCTMRGRGLPCWRSRER